MNRYEFDAGWELLCEVYEKNPKKSLANLVFERIKAWDAEAWRRVVQRLMDDPERGSFPRLGMIKGALSQSTISDRREATRQEGPECRAGCDQGEVHYKSAAGYTMVATCSVCHGGPKSWPMVNPVTFELVE